LFFGGDRELEFRAAYPFIKGSRDLGTKFVMGEGKRKRSREEKQKKESRKDPLTFGLCG